MGDAVRLTPKQLVRRNVQFLRELVETDFIRGNSHWRKRVHEEIGANTAVVRKRGKLSKNQVTLETILSTLKKNHGNLAATARDLEMHYSPLYRRLQLAEQDGLIKLKK